MTIHQNSPLCRLYIPYIPRYLTHPLGGVPKEFWGIFKKKKTPFNLFDFTTEKRPLTSESTMHVPQVVFLGCAARIGILKILPEVFTRF